MPPVDQRMHCAYEVLYSFEREDMSLDLCTPILVEVEVMGDGVVALDIWDVAAGVFGVYVGRVYRTPN